MSTLSVFTFFQVRQWEVSHESYKWNIEHLTVLGQHVFTDCKDDHISRASLVNKHFLLFNVSIYEPRVTFRVELLFLIECKTIYFVVYWWLGVDLMPRLHRSCFQTAVLIVQPACFKLSSEEASLSGPQTIIPPEWETRLAGAGWGPAKTMQFKKNNNNMRLVSNKGCGWEGESWLLTVKDKVEFRFMFCLINGLER